ncbi:phosphoacetylglucosamine mutase, partial [Piptocephalis cylindrospora]
STADALVTSASIDLNKPARIVFARDTRPSGPPLVAALSRALSAMGAEVTDYGILTTPQLHYMVRCLNTQGTPEAYGEPTKAGYYQKLATAFHRLVKGSAASNISGPIHVDCANGVGAPRLAELADSFAAMSSPLQFDILKTEIDSPALLNSECGADYVKTRQDGPKGIALTPGERYASFDGDADRIVFYYADPQDRTFRLLDGDKIAGLAAMYFAELCKAADIELNIGVVQTAYANGSSTSYLRNTLQLPVSCVCTGVKHLHHEAERYDIGVYFEANGHGTVLFSQQALKAFKTTEAHSPAHASALEKLQALADLINQTVGDAMSDLLFVEAILANKQWPLERWDQDYTDLPSRLVRVLVEDRSAFRTTMADTQLVAPAGLQEKIDAEIAKFSAGRAFVRPSGTEDVVRVYAEAATRSECDTLAWKVAGLVFDLAGGKGERPSEFL